MTCYSLGMARTVGYHISPSKHMLLLIYSYSSVTVLFDEAASFIDPGAGLSQLDFFPDSDFIYDSLFASSVQLDIQLSGNSPQSVPKSPPKPAGPIIRVYGSDEDLYVSYRSLILLFKQLVKHNN